MKKKFRTGFVILIVICVLAAGLYTAGRVCWNYAKLRLSQYIDKQVAQEVEQKIGRASCRERVSIRV